MLLWFGVWSIRSSFIASDGALALVDQLLIGASAAIALSAGLLCILCWRLTGETPVLSMGIAVALFGAVTIGLTGLLPEVGVYSNATATALSWMRPASLLVVLSLLVYSLSAPPIDARLRPRTVLLPAVTLMAGLTLLLPLLRIRGMSGGVGRHLETTGVAGLLVALAWLGLAAAFWIAGVRRDRRLLLWFALALLGLGLSELMRLATPPTEPMSAVGAGLLSLTGLAFALSGAVRELQWAYAEQSGRLLDSMVTTMTVQEQLRAREEVQEERAHEARNALSAIEGATRTLEHYRDTLDESARVSLESAISAEIIRLQRLIAPDPADQALAPFDLAQTLAPLITVERLAGTRIDCDVPDGVMGIGRQADVAEIVQNLLVNARRYAPGAPVLVRVDRQRSSLILAVEDRGPGVVEHQREIIFQRGARGDLALGHSGSGLGLFISAQLARAQGGDLWVDERPGGGASFKLRLAAAETSHLGNRQPEARRKHRVENRHHLGQAAELDSFLPRRRAH